MSVALTVPQWSVGTTISLFQLPGSLTWQNPTVMTGEPYYGTMFSNTSNTMFLTGNYVAFSTPGTLFTLLDSSNNAYSITLKVLPPLYTVSSAGIVYVRDSITNLPMTFRAPNNISGSVVVNGLIPGPSTILPRTISASFTDYNFSPSLPGGLLSSIDGSGNVSITGLPTTARSQSTYTFYARTSNTQTTSNAFLLEVAAARYQFYTISGGVSAATLNYKKLNHLVIGVRGDPGILRYENLPTGMSINFSDTQIDISGTPTQFIDISQTTRLSLTNFRYSTNFTYAFTMNPSLEIIVPTSVRAYRNVEYTPSSPMFTARIRGYPSQCNSYVVSASGAQVTQNGAVYGSLISDQTITITASGSSLFNQASVPVEVLRDSVTFNPYQVKPIFQNVRYSNSFTAFATSGQAVQYFAQPPFANELGISIHPLTGSVTGIPRGVSTVSNYTIVARTPQGVRGYLNIVLDTVPDTVTVSSYGLGQFCSPSPNRIQLIQGHPILQSEYTVPLEFRASTASGDGIAGFFASGLPSGISLTAEGVLYGTPTLYGNFSSTITVRSFNGISTVATLNFAIARDILFLPLNTDFVVDYESTSLYSLQGYALSESRIVSYSVSGAPIGVTVASGTLSIVAIAYQTVTPFTITATTELGVTLTKVATLTVNDPRVGKFVSPTGFLLLASTCPIVTAPSGFTFSVSGSPDVGVTDSTLVRTTETAIYPPQLVTLTADVNLAIPLRISTQLIRPLVSTTYRWIQYVPIDIQITSDGVPGNVSYAIPNPPFGTRWNPISSTLTGSPTQLTILDSFMVYATDGFTTIAFPIHYSIATPTYLRTFSAPSSYTNYTKQRAFVNAAAHAVNGIAYLPDPMIGSQTGPYPPDTFKDTICAKCFSGNAAITSIRKRSFILDGGGVSADFAIIYDNNCIAVYIFDGGMVVGCI